jgi:hypothetical protein
MTTNDVQDSKGIHERPLRPRLGTKTYHFHFILLAEIGALLSSQRALEGLHKVTQKGMDTGKEKN